MISIVDRDTRGLLKKGGYWGKWLIPVTTKKLEGDPRERYRSLTLRTGKRQVNWEVVWKIAVLLLLAKAAYGQQVRATASAPTYQENQIVPLSVDLTGALRTSGGGGSGGGLTDAQLRASPVPMSLATIPLATNAATESTLSSVLGRLPALVSGRIPVDGSGVTQPVSISGSVPVTGTFWQATQPVSGTVAVSNFPGTQPVSGSVSVSNFPATQAVTGTFFQATQPVSIAATVAVSGPLTDVQLRATPVPISGSVTATGPLTDAQLRAVAVPVSGTFWQATQPVSGTVTANAGTGTFAVSAASLPLPTGAATAAKQPALGTAGSASADVISVQGVASGTPLRVDLGATTANGTSLNVNCTGGCAGASEAQTYTWTVPDVVAGSNKLFLDLFNAAGSGKLVKVRGIYPIMKTDVAVVGALALRFDLFRTSAIGTGGTAAVYKSPTRDVAGGSIVPADTNNLDLPAQITGRHLPTGGATAASWVRRFACFTEETNAATYDCSGQTNFLEIVTGGQPFVLREGQGLLLQQGSVATLNNIAFTVVFSVE